MTPVQDGHLTVLLPSIESDMFDNYCSEFGNPESQHYFFLRDVEEFYSADTLTNNGTRAELPYDADTKLIKIIVICHI